jgi:hypothetical protein
MKETVRLSVNIEPLADKTLREEANKFGGSKMLGFIISELIERCENEVWEEIAEEVRLGRNELLEARRAADRKRKADERARLKRKRGKIGNLMWRTDTRSFGESQVGATKSESDFPTELSALICS